jgi:biopolymer transport protein TolR
MLQRKPLSTPNITPLVDVLLILLVIVMLTSSLFVKSLSVTLPKTDLNAPAVAVKSLSISITASGKVLVNNVELPLSSAVEKVKPGVSVLVYVDQAATYAEMAKVLSALQARNPSSVSLMVR